MTSGTYLTVICTFMKKAHSKPSGDDVTSLLRRIADLGYIPTHEDIERVMKEIGSCDHHLWFKLSPGSYNLLRLILEERFEYVFKYTYSEVIDSKSEDVDVREQDKDQFKDLKISMAKSILAIRDDKSICHTGTLPENLITLYRVASIILDDKKDRY